MMDQGGITTKEKAKNLVGKFGYDLAIEMCDFVITNSLEVIQTQIFLGDVKKQIEKLKVT
jgi:hypothetical protein